MDLMVTADYEALSRAAADLFAEIVAANPSANIVIATGSTPMGMYEELAIRASQADLDLSRIRVFQLDEYLGIGPDDPRSLYGWMRRAFLHPLDIPEDHVVRLRGDAPDPEAACREYEHVVHDAGGYDLAVLGLGPNGHLGFNEPPAQPDAPTRVVDLAPESVESNARYWGGPDRVPRRALTAGLDLLLASRRILLLVSGESKRDILYRTVHGLVTEDVPASYLQHHPHTTIVADKEGVSLPQRQPQ